MSLPALNRLDQRGDLISGAWLTANEQYDSLVQRTIKQTPAISGFVALGSLLEAFDQTIAQSFLICLISILGFAAALVAAVVYNHARISLSERARDLGSLRVLGFSRREVGAMLIGEEAALVLAAAFTRCRWILVRNNKAGRIYKQCRQRMRRRGHGWPRRKPLGPSKRRNGLARRGWPESNCRHLELYRAREAERVAEMEVQAATSRTHAALHEVGNAHAALLGAAPGTDIGPLTITAPVDGTVLRVYEECERAVTIGAPIWRSEI